MAAAPGGQDRAAGRLVDGRERAQIILATKKGRAELAAKSGLSEKLILGRVNRADLFRVNGVGTQYADLLEHAGVDTVVELANRKAENLVGKTTRVNAEKKLVRLLPALSKVQDWIAQAKKLPRRVSY